MKIFVELSSKLRHVFVIQRASYALTKTCKSNLETQNQPPHGSLNTCQACQTCEVAFCGSYPVRAQVRPGDFHPSHSGKTGALCLLNPLAGSVAPIGHRHIPEICDSEHLTDSGHGPSASGKDWLNQLGTFTTSSGTANPVAHARTRGKAPRTLQTSAKGVELARDSHTGRIPAYEVGRVGLQRKSSQARLLEYLGTGKGSAVASALETAVRTDSSRQKAAPVQFLTGDLLSGRLYVHQAS